MHIRTAKNPHKSRSTSINPIKALPRRKSTSKLPHKLKKSNVLTTTTRSMAFSFAKQTSMYQTNQPKATLPWDKHAANVTIRTTFQMHQEAEQEKIKELDKLKKSDFEQYRRQVDSNFLDEAKAEADLLFRQTSAQNNAPSTAPSQDSFSRPHTDAEVQQNYLNELRKYEQSRLLGPKENKFTFSRDQHTNFSNQGTRLDYSVAPDLPSRSDRSSPAYHSNPSASNQPSPPLTTKSGFSLTKVVQPTLDAVKRSDVTGTSLNDLEALFKHSKLSGVFAQQQTGPTFWSNFADGQTIYFMGTRQIIDQYGKMPEPTYAFLERKISKNMRQLHDTFTTYNYSTGQPIITQTVTNLEPDLTKGVVKEKNSPTPEISTKTALKLRGVGWKWHSAVMMTRMEYQITDPSQPKPEDVYNVTRFKYKETGFTAEKVVRQNDTLVGTVIDEMRIVPRHNYQSKLDSCINMEPEKH